MLLLELNFTSQELNDIIAKHFGSHVVVFISGNTKQIEGDLLHIGHIIKEMALKCTYVGMRDSS